MEECRVDHGPAVRGAVPQGGEFVRRSRSLKCGSERRGETSWARGFAYSAQRSHLR